jgi:hypothetical protein
MVSRRLACVAVASLAALAGCELVVDDGTRVLASEDGGMDGGRLSTEAGVLDVAPPDAGTGPGCASVCTDTATSCRQTCASTLATCTSACPGHAPGPCQDQCTQADMQCDGNCDLQCVACFTQTDCAGSSACST